MFFKKNKSAPPPEHKQASSSQPNFPGEQSLFAPSINPLPSQIDFGFGAASPAPAQSPAQSNQPSFPSQAGDMIWETTTTNIITEPADTSWDTKQTPSQIEPFQAASQTAPLTHPELSAEQAWAALSPSLSEHSTLEWNASPDPIEPSQPYLQETFENYTPPALPTETPDTLWQAPETLQDPLDDEFNTGFETSFKPGFEAGEDPDFATGPAALSEDHALFSDFYHPEKISSLSNEAIPSYERFEGPASNADASPTITDSFNLETDPLAQDWEAQPDTLSFLEPEPSLEFEPLAFESPTLEDASSAPLSVSDTSYNLEFSVFEEALDTPPEPSLFLTPPEPVTQEEAVAPPPLPDIITEQPTLLGNASLPFTETAPLSFTEPEAGLDSFSLTTDYPFTEELSLPLTEESFWQNLGAPELAEPGEQASVDPATFLDSINQQLYPPNLFPSAPPELDEGTLAFEEAAQFLFPETLGNSVDWSDDHLSEPFFPSSSLDHLELSESPLELGGSFQSEASLMNDLSSPLQARQPWEPVIPDLTGPAPISGSPSAASYGQSDFQDPTKRPAFSAGLETDATSLQGAAQDFINEIENTDLFNFPEHEFPATSLAPDEFPVIPENFSRPDLTLESALTPPDFLQNAPASVEMPTIPETADVSSFLPVDSTLYIPELEISAAHEDEDEVPSYNLTGSPDFSSSERPVPFDEQSEHSETSFKTPEDPSTDYSPTDTWFSENAETDLQFPEIEPAWPSPVPGFPQSEVSVNLPAAKEDDDFYVTAFTLNEQGTIIPSPSTSTEPAESAAPISSTPQSFQNQDALPPSAASSAPPYAEPVFSALEILTAPTLKRNDSFESITDSEFAEEWANAFNAEPMPPFTQEERNENQSVTQDFDAFLPSQSVAPKLQATEPLETQATEPTFEIFPQSPAELQPQPSSPLNEALFEPLLFQTGSQTEASEPTFDLFSHPLDPADREPVILSPQALSLDDEPDTDSSFDLFSLQAAEAQAFAQSSPLSNITEPSLWENAQPEPEAPPLIPVPSPASTHKPAPLPQVETDSLEAQWQAPIPEPAPIPSATNKPATNVATELMLGNLEVVSICSLSAEKRLLVVQSKGIYALMGQYGMEQPEISVLKVFEYNPIAYQNTFTAAAEGQAGAQGMYVVQVGTWHAIISTFQNKITLHTELG